MLTFQISTFDLHTPTEKLTVKMGVDGLHNVYNLTGVIIAAHKFLDLPYDKILPTIASFTGVSGRMEEVGKVKGKTFLLTMHTILQVWKQFLRNLKNCSETLQQ